MLTINYSYLTVPEVDIYSPLPFSFQKKIHFNLAGSFKENLYSREKSMLNQLKLKCVNSNSIQHEVDARLEVTINS